MTLPTHVPRATILLIARMLGLPPTKVVSMYLDADVLLVVLLDKDGRALEPECIEVDDR